MGAFYVAFGLGVRGGGSETLFVPAVWPGALEMVLERGTERFGNTIQATAA